MYQIKLNDWKDVYHHTKTQKQLDYLFAAQMREGKKYVF